MDSGDIANMFKDYFLDLGRNIAESIGGNNVNHLNYLTLINQPNSFFSRPILVIPLKIEFALWKINKAISIQFQWKFENQCDITSICLKNFINRSLTPGVFSDNHKKSHVTMIPMESDKKCNLSNYRPISVLSVFSKVFEKVYMHSWMITWKITWSCINNNLAFVLRSLLLRPFYI